MDDSATITDATCNLCATHTNGFGTYGGNINNISALRKVFLVPIAYTFGRNGLNVEEFITAMKNNAQKEKTAARKCSPL